VNGVFSLAKIPQLIIGTDLPVPTGGGLFHSKTSYSNAPAFRGGALDDRYRGPRRSGELLGRLERRSQICKFSHRRAELPVTVPPRIDPSLESQTKNERPDPKLFGEVRKHGLTGVLGFGKCLKG
jgi:hypothetical protein